MKLLSKANKDVIRRKKGLALAGSDIYIESDLTVVEARVGKTIREIAKEMKAKGQLVRAIGNQLVLNSSHPNLQSMRWDSNRACDFS